MFDEDNGFGSCHYLIHKAKGEILIKTAKNDSFQRLSTFLAASHVNNQGPFSRSFICAEMKYDKENCFPFSTKALGHFCLYLTKKLDNTNLRMRLIIFFVIVDCVLTQQSLLFLPTVLNDLELTQGTSIFGIMLHIAGQNVCETES